MEAAIVGLVCSVVTLVIKALVDLSVDRYQKAKKERDEREDLEAELRVTAFMWKEHAFAVRVAAIKAGVSPDDLPAVPREE